MLREVILAGGEGFGSLAWTIRGLFVVSAFMPSLAI
jgi:hypothetical protein